MMHTGDLRPKAVESLLDLRPSAVWRTFLRQSAAFWWLSVYVMFEYVRPQQIYRSLAVMPWGSITIGCAVMMSLNEPVRRRFFFLDGLLLLYTAILLASIPVAYEPGYAISNLQLWINWLLLYYLTTRVVTSETRLYLFFLLFLLWSLKMSQHGTRVLVNRGFGFARWGANGGPGWFQNSGEFAIQMCIFLPLSLHFVLALRKRWPKWKTVGLLGLLPGTAALSVIASSSRGGQLAAIGTLLVMNGQSRKRWRGFFALGVLIPALWFLIPPQQKARFSSMGDDETSQYRLTYWKDGLEIMEQHPILGVGYSNWLPFYRNNYMPEGQLPHNIFIQAGAELGYTGLAAFLLLIGGTFVANARTRRRAQRIPEWRPFLRGFAFGLDAALVGYLVSGFFVTVLYYPFFWMNLSMTAALYLVVERRARGAGSPRAVQRRQPVVRPVIPTSRGGGMSPAQLRSPSGPHS